MNSEDRRALRAIADNIMERCECPDLACPCVVDADMIRGILSRLPAEVPSGQRPDSEGFKGY